MSYLDMLTTTFPTTQSSWTDKWRFPRLRYICNCYDEWTWQIYVFPHFAL